MLESNKIYKLEFGKKLEFYMEKRKLSYQTLANQAGVEKKTIYNILKGVHEPKLSTIIRLCFVLEITPNDLISIPDELSYE
ncbi:DNA-binding XRE family transcriptional regulator [Chitinophaga skermanii]|uniref:DNA-binding XRE family transcriptional regulator n=1 Tax=Chitinophaga skermanii TaxID=331697 RepID=A0A327Q9Z9_9BACT|nr:DNA-binding XRE family transcriptional regulator [Chitinophaga skermanii]